MAGIGFELRKLFKEDSVFSKIRGTALASAVTIGPVILVITSLMLIQVLQNYIDIPYIEKELLSSTILYIFIFSLLVIAPLDSAVSRYVSDQLYENKKDSVLPAYYVGIGINITIAFVLGAPFCIWAVVVGDVDPFYMFCAYCFFISVMLTFHAMTFISALKEYKKISFAFFIGVLITILLIFSFIFLFKIAYINAVIYGYAIGFTFIAFRFHTLIKQYFTENDKSYKKFLKSLWKLKILIVINFSYILGLYIHNFVVWNSSLGIVVNDVFLSAPLYDLATCIAMFTNISVLVIFTVQVETKFFLKYQEFCQVISGGSKSAIIVAQKIMFKTLVEQMVYLIGMQIIITIPLYLLSVILLPTFGYDGLMLTIYPTLCAAYFVTFIMYALIIFLYYFDDKIGACIVSASFLIVTFIVSLIVVQYSPTYYGLGLLSGAFVGGSFAFFRIRYVAKHFTRMTLCKGTIIKQRYYKSSTEHIILNKNATKYEPQNKK